MDFLETLTARLTAIHARCAATSFEVHRDGVCLARVGLACRLTSTDREELLVRMAPYAPNRSRRELQDIVGGSFTRTTRNTRALGLFVSPDTLVIADAHDFELFGVVGVAVMCLGDSDFEWWS